MSQAADPVGPVPGKFIIKFKPGVKVDPSRMALSAGEKLSPLSRLKVQPTLDGAEVFERFYQFQSPDLSLNASEVAELIGADRVESVEPDYYLEFFDLPTDDLFPDQWYLNNEGQPYLGIERNDGEYNDVQVIKAGTPGADINLRPVYDDPPAETTRVVVAVVDSGTDLEHPELEGRIWINPDEIPNNGVDDDHNGFIDDTCGYDISGDVTSLFDPVGDNDPTDTHGHGTHIAGIIAANANGTGVVGIAPFAVIMPVKIRPNATTSVGAAGIVYAVNAGAQAINISWGTPFESAVLREAISFARRNGVFVGIAPGNTGDNERYYPAAYDSAFVVAAGNSDGYQETWSTYGAHIDVVAPGRDILSLRASGTDMYAEAYEPGVRIVDHIYYLADGTSMATPVVVGAAALMLGIHPGLTLDAIEEALRYGADDLVDPWNVGDTLYGPDTISGYGYLNVAQSLSLVQGGGLHFTSPVLRNRYTGDIPVKIAPVVGYTGSWQLDYTIGLDSDDWQFLATGDELPVDSLIYTFNDPSLQGYIKFRLTDKFGSVVVTNCIHVRGRGLVLSSPIEGYEMQYSVSIIGDAYGPDYDSVKVQYRKQGETLKTLMTSTGEYFDSLFVEWAVSGVDTGNFDIYLNGYFGEDILTDSVGILVSSAFAQGWPRDLAGLGAVSPVCDDLDGDGIRELIIATSRGLMVFEANGEVRAGFPVLAGENVRCVPVVYDIDRDGKKEIVFTSADGIHAYNPDGSTVEGWPVLCYTGRIPYGYGFPNPTITRLGVDEDSAIVIINRIGQVLAYEFDGSSYFFSLGGLFASLDPRASDYYSLGGFASPFVSACDLTGDGLQELIASYTSPYPYSGMAIFDGRTGQPAFDALSPIQQKVVDVHGTALADLNGDQLPEIIILGSDTTGVPHIYAKTNGIIDVPGFPIALPDVASWIASYPVVADLNLDGVPEILCTFFEYDIGSMYIFNADGTAYLTRDGRPYGEVFYDDVTFATPMVANLTGDEYPEIIFRSGYILPSTGQERVYIFDHEVNLLPDWPVTTPARPGEVFSSRYSPVVDDLDGDGLVELMLVSDGQQMLVWDFDASYDEGRNRTKLLVDNVNSGILRLLGPGTDVDDAPSTLPRKLSLAQNYPNPFNPSTTIRFNLDRGSEVRLEVFNILGQKVATLIDEKLPAGQHEAVFDGGELASGIYLYRLLTDSSIMSRKMMLLK